MATDIQDILKAKGFTLDFGHMKDALGKTEGWCIKLNLKCHTPPAKIFLHECVHYLNPEMSEADVVKLESKLWKKLTHKEALKLYKKLFR